MQNASPESERQNSSCPHNPEVAGPHEAGGQRVIFISGDDADAKADVVALFQDAGFAAIDLGDLATGGAMQQIHHPLAGVNLIRL